MRITEGARVDLNIIMVDAADEDAFGVGRRLVAINASKQDGGRYVQDSLDDSPRGNRDAPTDIWGGTRYLSSGT